MSVLQFVLLLSVGPEPDNIAGNRAREARQRNWFVRLDEPGLITHTVVVLGRIQGGHNDALESSLNFGSKATPDWPRREFGGHANPHNPAGNSKLELRMT